MDGLAPPMVGAQRPRVMEEGRRFYKMSGSGNDFVFFDSGVSATDPLETPESIQEICARGTGVGADGVVFLRPASSDGFSIRYYNSDGSPGELCGNATLCALRLASGLGIVSSDEVSIGTDAGVITARMAGGEPEIDLAPVTEVRPAVPEIPTTEREQMLGFARAGVPHVVIVDQDVSSADVIGRGGRIRRDRSLRDGANVNFVSRMGDAWAIRTYERGVEGETLACGTGAVAAGILLTEWGLATSPVGLITKSGRRLRVTVRQEGNVWLPSLGGPADLVFTGWIPERGS